jgi:large subunit ribosomal protein L25
VPAVVYGRGQDALSVEINARELDAALHTEAGTNALIDLDVNGSAHLTVAREVQRHPVRGDIIHLDFVKISLAEKIEAEVVLEPEGVPYGVREDGGVLETLRAVVNIEALPTDIPASIPAEIGALHIGDSFSVSDLVAVEGVEFLDDPETTLYTVVAPRVEEEVAVEVLLDEEGMPIELEEGEELEEGVEGEEEPSAEAGESGDAEESS